jgi:hypothetical protein
MHNTYNYNNKIVIENNLAKQQNGHQTDLIFIYLLTCYICMAAKEVQIGLSTKYVAHTIQNRPLSPP